MVQIINDCTKKVINVRYPIHNYDKDLDLKYKIYASFYNDPDQIETGNVIRYYPDYIQIVSRSASAVHVISVFDKLKNELVKFKFNVNEIYIGNPYISKLIKDVAQGIRELDALFLIQYIIYRDLGIKFNRTQSFNITQYTKFQTNVYNGLAITNDPNKNSSGSLLYPGVNRSSLLTCNVIFELTKKNEWISLLKVFKKFPLSNELPFVYFYNKNEPMLKYHTKFQDLPLLKSWLLNDKKELKHSQGLWFKYMINGRYVSCNVFNNGQMKVILSWNTQDHTQFSVLDTLKKDFGELLKLFKMYLPETEIDGNFVYDHSNVQFFIKSNVKFEKVYFEFQNSSKFQVLVFKAGGVLSVVYKSTKLSINQVEHNGAVHYSIIVTQLKNPSLLQEIQSQVSQVFYKLQTKKSSVTDSIKKEINKHGVFKSVKIKPIANIKLLRKHGIEIDSTRCQRSRQPIIVNKGSGSGQKIKYNDITLGCPTKKHPFIGVIQKNELCCFKIDQSHKQVYKNFFSEKVPRLNDFILGQLNLQEQFEKHIFTLNKVLEPGRRGTIPKRLTAIFKDNNPIYRIGNAQNYYSVFNIIGILLRQELDILNLIKEQVTKDTFFTFNNGNVLGMYNIETYKNLLVSPKPGKVLDHTLVLDPIALYIKKRVIIVNTVTKQVTLYGTGTDSLILLYNPVKSIYEGVIQDSGLGFFDNNSKLVKNLELLVKIKKGDITPELVYAAIKGKGSASVSQVLDHNNKVKYISTAGGLIPVSPGYGGTINVSIKTNYGLVDLKKQVELLESLSKNISGLSPDRVIIRPTTSTVIGVTTKSGLMVPVSPEKLTTNINNVKVPHLYYNLVPDIQASIQSNKTVDNDSTPFLTKQKFIEELYQRLRLHISKVITELNVNKIQSILKSKVSLKNRFDSLNAAISNVISEGNLIQVTPGYPKNLPKELPVSRLVLDHFCNAQGKLKITKSDLKLFINKISTELLNSNYKVLSKTGVSIDIEDENHYIIRESEAILTNSKDIKSKVNKFNK